jgi:RNA polymerase sigma-54 factor
MKSASIFSQPSEILYLKYPFFQVLHMKFHALKLPLIEFSEWLHEEIKKNPFLKLEEATPFSQACSSIPKDTKLSPKASSLPDALYDYLIRQIKLRFPQKDWIKAKEVIDQLDENGFLPASFQNTLIKKIQTLTPHGIAARNIQECLLIQLQQGGKKNSLAYRIVKNHFHDLLNNNLSSIRKKLRCSLSELCMTIKKEVCSLNYQPSATFSVTPVFSLIPDIVIKKEKRHLSIFLNENPLPRFSVRKLFDSGDNKQEILHAKWLNHILKKRQAALQRLAQFLFSKHRAFLLGENIVFEPTSIKEVSQNLKIDESILVHTMANKYLSSPAGVFSLKNFFF